MKRGMSVFSAILLLALAFSLLAAPAAEEKKMSKKASKLMAKALDAINEKQPDQAIDLLREVVALEPENAMVRHNLAVLYFEKGLADEAIASFEEALRLQPDYLNAQLALRQVLLDAGKKASARKEYEKANGYLLKLDGMPRPGGENIGLQAQALYLLGFNFFNLQQYTKAIEYFSRCQASEGLEKENLELYANAIYFLGMMGYVQGQYAVSNEHFRKYLVLYAGDGAKPEFFSHAHYFIGANLFRLLQERLAKGDVDKMEESAAEILPYLKVAVESKLPSEDLYVMLGNCHVYRQEYDQALEAYRQLIDLFPQSPQVNNYLAFLGQLQGMQRQAQKGKKKN